jgi:hypothetical protein
LQPSLLVAALVIQAAGIALPGGACGAEDGVVVRVTFIGIASMTLATGRTCSSPRRWRC